MRPRDLTGDGRERPIGCPVPMISPVDDIDDVGASIPFADEPGPVGKPSGQTFILALGQSFKRCMEAL